MTCCGPGRRQRRDGRRVSPRVEAGDGDDLHAGRPGRGYRGGRSRIRVTAMHQHDHSAQRGRRAPGRQPGGAGDDLKRGKLGREQRAADTDVEHGMSRQRAGLGPQDDAGRGGGGTLTGARCSARTAGLGWRARPRAACRGSGDLRREQQQRRVRALGPAGCPGQVGLAVRVRDHDDGRGGEQPPGRARGHDVGRAGQHRRRRLGRPGDGRQADAGRQRRARARRPSRRPRGREAASVHAPRSRYPAADSSLPRLECHAVASGRLNAPCPEHRISPHEIHRSCGVLPWHPQNGHALEW